MIATIAVRPDTATITPPSGWSLVSRIDNTASGTSLAVYTKIAGASEGSNYTFTLSTNTGAAGGIEGFSGVDTARPVAVEAGKSTPSGTTHATPAVDTSKAYTPLYDFTYTLNAAGNRTQMVDASGTTTYAYDNLHRLTSVTYPGPTTDTYTYDANGNRTAKNSTAYVYDNADQMTAAGGVSYGYDNNGNQTSRGSDTFVYDHENRLTSATVGGAATTYTYNGDGLRMTRTSGGVTTNYIWDVAGGLPVLLRETQGDDQSVSGLVAHWPLSEGSGTTTADASGGGHTGTLNGASWTTGHDGSAVSFGAPNNHNVDVANFGSFTRMSVAAWVYRTGATSGRESIVSYKEGDPANCGFVLSLNEGGTNQYPRIWVMVNGAWIYAEQTTSVPLNTWVHLAATYDGTTIRLYRDGVQVASTAASGNISQCTQGMRIGNRAPGSTNMVFPGKVDEARIYDRAISATEVGYVMNGAPSAPSTTYVYGAGGMLYWADNSGTVTYRMGDALDSTMALANSAGVVTDSYSYDVFGAVRSHSGSSGTEFTFTGEQNDPNGLEYLRARYYDSATGRFLGRDPLGGGYPYAGNNPANMVDPTGLYTMCVDDPVWGYICYDSTQVGLGACSDSEDCHIYVGDGSAPGNVVTLVERYGNACVFQYGIGGAVACHHDQPMDPADMVLAAGGAEHLQRLNAPDPRLEKERRRCDEVRLAAGVTELISIALLYTIVSMDVWDQIEAGQMPQPGEYLSLAVLIAALGPGGYIVHTSGCI